MKPVPHFLVANIRISEQTAKFYLSFFTRKWRTKVQNPIGSVLWDVSTRYAWSTWQGRGEDAWSTWQVERKGSTWQAGGVCKTWQGRKTSGKAWLLKEENLDLLDIYKFQDGLSVFVAGLGGFADFLRDFFAIFIIFDGLGEPHSCFLLVGGNALAFQISFA